MATHIVSIVVDYGDAGASGNGDEIYDYGDYICVSIFQYCYILLQVAILPISREPLAPASPASP